MKNQKGFYVYFYYDKNDALLYIGLSNDVGQRFNAHQEDWMSEVGKVGVRKYQNKASMKLCEKYYIAKLKPKYNIKDATEDSLEIDFSDPVKLESMSKNEFINKYCKEEVMVRKRRITFKEKLMNLDCNIIRTNNIDLFDESILKCNLDKTAFLHVDYIFYFHNDILNDKNKNLSQAITNLKIKQIKEFLNNNEKCSNIMPFNLYFTSPKCFGAYTLISSTVINQEGIVTEINFSVTSFLSFSKNHLLINFDKLINSRTK